MAVSICVRVSGLDSVKAPDELRADLAEHTGLSWIEEPPAEDSKTLGTIDTIVLTAVVSASSEMIVKYAVKKAQEALHRLKSQYVHPPHTSVTVDPRPEGDPGITVEPQQEDGPGPTVDPRSEDGSASDRD